MYDSTNRKDIRRAEKDAKLAEDDRIDFIRAALTTKQGRTYFHNLLSQCHLFSDPFTGDALREAYSKGERNVGLGIYYDIVTHCPDAFVLMMQEATHREITNVRRYADHDDSDTGSTPAEHGGSEDSGGDAEGRLPDNFVDYNARAKD